MLSTALFIIWFSALAFLITRLLKKQAALSPAIAVCAFAFKVLAGCLYGYVHLRYYQGDDTWAYNAESMEEYAKPGCIRFINWRLRKFRQRQRRGHVRL